MKRIRRRVRNRIVGTTLTFLILLVGVIAVTGINKAGNNVANYDVQEDLLGNAVNYGIVTEWLNQGYHFDSNFAAKYFTGTHAWNGKFSIGTYTDGNPLDVIATKIGPPTNENLPGYHQTVTANGVNCSAVLRTAEEKTYANLSKKFTISDAFEDPQDESSHAIEVNDNGSKRYVVIDEKPIIKFEKEDDLNAEVDGMISAARIKSKEIAKRKSEKGKDYTIKCEGNSALVDISISNDNVVYVDATELLSDKFDNINILEGTDGGRFEKGNDTVQRMKDISVKKRKNQYLVFNFVKYEDAEEETEKPTDTPKETETAEPTEETKITEPTEKPEKIEEPESKQDSDGNEILEPTQNPENNEILEPTQEPAEEEKETEELNKNEETVSIFGNPTVAKAAVKNYKYDENNSNYKVHIKKLDALYDENGNEVKLNASSNSDDATNTMKTIIYNLPYSTHVWCNATIATVVCPDAKVKFGGGQWDMSTNAECAGWLVCRWVFTHCGEWHYCRKITTTTTEPPKEETTTEPPKEEETSTPTPEIATSSPNTTATPTPEIVTTTSTPTVVYYSFSPSPTPLIILEEDVPKTPATEGPIEIDEEKPPLSNYSQPDKPSNKTTTLIEKIPLSATVPETGDTINPFSLLVCMGVSLFSILGIVIIQKKR
jgi:hypothetical protein